jgi:membrane-bound lytic murein transglycosylase D
LKFKFSFLKNFNTVLIIIVLNIAMLFPGSLLAQLKNFSQVDSLETSPISSNLDQLMNLWYLDKMYFDTTIDNLNKYGFKKCEIPQYSDSIYKYRLTILNSPIPLTYNENVRKFIDLYTVRKRDQVERMLRLSHYYFPMFESVLDKHNLPLELKYVACIESALNTHAVSKSGATGLWQFMYGTAKLYNLQITSYIDDRRDPYKLTEAAVTFLGDLYNVYHDWLYVIAAYNCGPGNVNKAIKKSGNRKDFWEVYPYLPSETRGYVPAFIAANYVMNYYAEHNLYPRGLYNPGLLDTVTVYKRIRFDILAKSINMTVDELKELNPQYRKDEIPQSITDLGYTLRLPIDKSSRFHEMGDLVYKYQYYMDEQENEKLAIHDSVLNPPPFVSKNTAKYKTLYYKVKSGDKLDNVADWFDCNPSDIKKWNRIKGTYLSTGRTLTINVPLDLADYYKDVNQMTFIEKQKRVGKYNDSMPNAIASNQNNKQKNPELTASNDINSDYVYYTIKNGDTLWMIAQKFPGVTTSELMRLNNISHGKSLKPGQKIKIKPKS